MEVPDTIICVDCGQKARRMTLEPEFGWEMGDFVAYRCTGCNDRWDLVVEECDVGPGPSENPYAAEIAEVRQRLKDREA